MIVGYANRCGSPPPAVVSEAFRWEDGTLTAIDIAPTALELARERGAEAGVKVEWTQADD